jgi:large subunit ribosomal protein L34
LWIHYYLFRGTSQRAGKIGKVLFLGITWGKHFITPFALFCFLKRCGIIEGMSFTYSPKKKKRKTTHGFLVRQATPTGRRVLSRRRAKGRRKLAV